MSSVFVLVDQFDGAPRVSVHTSFEGLKAKMIAAVDCLIGTAEVDRALHTISGLTEDLAQAGVWISYEGDDSYLDVSYVEVGA